MASKTLYCGLCDTNEYAVNASKHKDHQSHLILHASMDEAFDKARFDELKRLYPDEFDKDGNYINRKRLMQRDRIEKKSSIYRKVGNS